MEPTFLSGRTFNLKKRGNNWFWFDNKKNHSLMRYSVLDEEPQVVLPISSYHFDVAGNKILFGQTISSNMDVYQTQSSDN